MPPSDRAGAIEHATNSRCARCGAGFRCAMCAGDEHCWCAAYPQVMPVPRIEAACYCPACIAELTARPEQPR